MFFFVNFLLEKFEMWIRAGGGGYQPMWIIFKFYNIIIKSANVDRGGGAGVNKKSRIWETSNLSTDGDSSTYTTVGWTKNTQKPNKILKRKKNNSKQKNLRLEICQN